MHPGRALLSAGGVVLLLPSLLLFAACSSQRSDAVPTPYGILDEERQLSRRTTFVVDKQA